MALVAEVCINIQAKNLDKSFSYLVPDNLQFVDVGWRVLVPFGTRKLEGFIIKITNDEPAIALKQIYDVLDEYSWFDDNLLETAKWLSDKYLCTLADALRLSIPGKSGVKTDYYFSFHDSLCEKAVLTFIDEQEKAYHDLLNFIKEQGSVKFKKVESLFGIDSVSYLRRLVRKGFLIIETNARKAIKPLYLKQVVLAVDLDRAQAERDTVKNKPAQLRLLDILLQNKELYIKELTKLKISHDTVKRLVDKGLVATKFVQVYRNSYDNKDEEAASFKLTEEQCSVLASINSFVIQRKHRTFLLHGITGSGKTQVYIEAVEKVRTCGRQAIVLVPEIALTSQIVRRFRSRFGDDVVVIHSKLSQGERYDNYEKLRTGKAGIVIGARSAVFAPVRSPGIIIIDEEHEFTYKQEEHPRYHTKDVAIKRAELAGGVVLLGSATPAVESYYEALNGKFSLLNMSKRIDGSYLPEVEIVDMREELKKGKRSVISSRLKSLLIETLEKHEQSIILLNRRGHSTFVLCRECGHVLKCPHCAVSLVYHNSGNILRCHYCDQNAPVPDVCPVCSSRYIRYFGTGTQKVEQELKELLPSARIVRMDQDTTGKKFSHDKILDDFSAGKFDILLGTQMVAKGHDIKNVTSVGIITADTALNLPDFRSAERTFALLTQAAGRAGRGVKPGKVVVQTYNPEHYAICAAQNHDYVSFYQQEIVYRKELNYPPFRQLLKMTIMAADERKAIREAEEITTILKNEFSFHQNTEVIGPFAAPIAKIKDVYRMNILIKTDNMAKVSRTIAINLIDSRANVSIDVNPLNVL